LVRQIAGEPTDHLTLPATLVVRAST
jgi:hypothetical protein